VGSDHAFSRSENVPFASPGLFSKITGKTMHEISLVRTIFRILEEEFPGETERIRGIYLSAGILSNVQPVLMQNAFEAVLPEEPGYTDCSLYVEVLPILIYCDHCHKTTEVNNYRFVCSCGKPGRNIVQGKELQISRVDFSP
jgi:hydrogenase nickel incorporation protein HypA/HybF